MIWKGYAIVDKAGLHGILNGKGKVIIPPVYNHFFNVLPDYLVVGKGDSVGILQLHTGKQILPVSYRYISPITDNLFLIHTRNKLQGIFKGSTGKWFLAPEYNEIIGDGYSNAGTHYIAKKKNRLLYFTIAGDGRFSIDKKRWKP